MAPSNMEQQFEYTHKKFNCGYSHKKLGMRLVRRASQDEREEQINQEQNDSFSKMDFEYYKTSNSPSALFRPYVSEEEREESSIRMNHQIDSQCETLMQPISQDFTATAYQYYAQYFSQQQSADAYALKLQRQRAALYMKHVMQYYDNGNGWPTMHPNAFNNRQLC